MDPIADSIKDILAAGACLYLLRVVCNMYAESDHQAIESDKLKNSLKSKWHRQGWFRKALAASAIALLYAAASWVFADIRSFGWFVAYFSAFLLLSGALWWYWFDQELNRLRGLKRWYIGYTSDIDKWLRSMQARHGWNWRQTNLYIKLPAIGLTALILLTCIMMRNW